MSFGGDEVAESVIKIFRQLPQKAKPRTYPDGSQEWTVLSGICIALPDESQLDCVALGTGMRCLPHGKLPLAQGRCLHDWHAEVVAIRSFNLFLLQECESLAQDSTYASRHVRFRDAEDRVPGSEQPFALKDGLHILMYCSEAPCGDSSMELTMSAQQDATAWVTPAADADSPLSGRGYFSELGAVRRKPARADAPLSLSKSCSDKLAMKQCTSLLSAVTSLVVHPSNAYLHRLVIPESQHITKSTTRAFGGSGRMSSLSQTQIAWEGGLGFRPFQMLTCTTEFELCKPRTSSRKATGSNLTASWTPNSQEVLVGGTVEGNKQFSPRGASKISRLRLWDRAISALETVAMPTLVSARTLTQSYSDLKSGPQLATRQLVKNQVRAKSLTNWQLNTGDDGFSRA